MIEVLTVPGRFFEKLKDNPSFALPLLLRTVGAALVIYFFFSRVDMRWFIDQTLLAQNIPPEKLAEVRAVLSANGMMWPGIASSVISTVVSCVGLAVYFLLFSKITGASISFRQWFAFASWVKFPLVLSIIASLIAAMSINSHSLLDAVFVTHVDPLLVQVDVHSRWYKALTGIDLLDIWTIALATIGWRQWTKASMGLSIVVAAIPFAGWCLFSVVLTFLTQ